MDSSNISAIRPPIIAIMGHVDHGKSTLLDTIRQCNTVSGEAGGITQKVSAYCVEHTLPDGKKRKITFIDTPGHAAFQSIRTRSANIADIAVLIVAADDGVKPQTREAYNTIIESGVPYIVAINKIDKPGSDVPRVIRELLEMGCYTEGNGGDISYVEISAKTGVGIDELLETLLLLSEFIDLAYDPDVQATGFIIESHMDSQRGIAATLVIKNGTLNKSDYVAAGLGWSPARMIESFDGKQLSSANSSDPVTLYGFSEICSAGTEFTAFTERESAIASTEQCTDSLRIIDEIPVSDETNIIPIIIKCDSMGSMDAVVGEIRKLCSDRLFFKIVHAGIGNINESDIHIVTKNDEPVIIGFNVNIDKQVSEMPLASKMHIKTFEIIYRITEWIAEIAENRKFRKKIESQTGAGQVLKIFSVEKNDYLIGVRIASGVFTVGDTVRIVRGRDIAMRGKIKNIQSGKIPMNKLDAGNDAGMMITLPEAPRQFDIIESFEMIEG